MPPAFSGVFLAFVFLQFLTDFILFYFYKKKCYWYLIEIALNLYLALNNMDILTILSILIHENGISSIFCPFIFL